MMRDPLEATLRDWARLGVMYGVTISRQTPDIESLLVATARVMPGMARLLPTTVVWLSEYERLVCRHRLAHLAQQIVDVDTSAALGLTLEFARRNTQTDHLSIAIEACRTAEVAMPLFLVDRSSAAVGRMVEREASATARRWGLWTTEPTVKTDALRPRRWLMATNPTLRDRAVFSGNLRASILVTLNADAAAGASESALSRACGVTRKALRDALDHLEFCGFITRHATGRRSRIALNHEAVTSIGGRKKEARVR